MKSTRSQLAEVLDGVHLEAIRAIQEVDPIVYRNARDTLVEMLLEVPLSWGQYGQTLERDSLQALDLFEDDPILAITTRLHEQMQQALRGRSREIAIEAIGLPYEVAQRAVPLGATGLADRALNLLLDGYPESRRAQDPAVREASLDLLLRYLMEYCNFVLPIRIQDESLSTDDRIQTGVFLRLAFTKVTELLKLAIDAEDVSSFRFVDDQWSLTLNHWEPEYESPRDFEVEILESQLGVSADQTATAREQLAANQRMTKLKTDLRNQRTAMRLGLASWTFRRLPNTATPSEGLQEILRILVAHFSNPQDVASACDLALRIEWSGERSPWFQWTMEELPEGQAHAIASDIDLLRTFLVVAAHTVSLEQPGELQPFDWLHSRQSELTSMLDQLPADPALRAFSEDPISLRERVTALRGMLAAAAERIVAIEAARLRSAPLNEERVQLFHSQLEEAWHTHRLVPSVFSIGDAYRRINEYPSEKVPVRGVRQLIPKGLLIDDSRLVGEEMVAREIGRHIASVELNALVAILENTRELPGKGGDLARALQEAFSSLRTQGYDPALLMIPIDRDLLAELGLESSFIQRPEPPSSISLGEGAKHWYVGTLDGAHIFEWPMIPKDRVYVVDLRRFAQWREYWATRDGGDFLIELRTYDESSAERLAREAPELYRTTKRRSIASRAMEIQQHVLVKAGTRSALEVREPEAAGYLSLPS